MTRTSGAYSCPCFGSRRSTVASKTAPLSRADDPATNPTDGPARRRASCRSRLGGSTSGGCGASLGMPSQPAADPAVAALDRGLTWTERSQMAQPLGVVDRLLLGIRHRSACGCERGSRPRGRAARCSASDRRDKQRGAAEDTRAGAVCSPDESALDATEPWVPALGSRRRAPARRGYDRRRPFGADTFPAGH